MSKSIKFLALTFSEGVNVLAGLLFLPYLARAMDIIDYGTYGQVILIISLAAGMIGFGLAKIIFAYLPNRNYNQSDTLFSNLLSSFVIGLIGLLLLLLISPIIATYFDNKSLQVLINIYCFSLPFTLMYTSLNASLIFFDKVKESAMINVTTNLIRITLVLICVQIFSSIQYIFIALLIISILQCLLCFIYLPTQIKANRQVSTKSIISQLKSGWGFGLASFIGVLFYKVDGLMISSMIDTATFAIYKNGAFEIPFISSIYVSITAILLPEASKFYQDKKFVEIVSLKTKVITNTAMIIFPTIIFCMIFSEQVITTLFSEKYIESAPLFMIYSFILLMRFTSYDELFIVSDNNHLLPIIYGFALIVNIVLNYILINILGVIGAAIASVISFYILISILFTKGTAIINSKPTQYLEFKKLIQLSLISITTCSTIYFITTLFSVNEFILVFIFGIYSLVVYHFILKLHLIDHNILRDVMTRMGILKVPLLVFDKIYYNKND